MSAQDEFNEQLLETLSSLVDKVKELQLQLYSKSVDIEYLESKVSKINKLINTTR